MKRTIVTVALVLCVLAAAVIFGACQSRVDVPNEPTAPTDGGNTDGQDDGDTGSTEAQGSISFLTLVRDEKQSNAFYGVVSHATESLRFSEEIEVSGDATYAVLADASDTTSKLADPVSLTEGDNCFYVLETVGDRQTVYTVTVRRKPIYTVSFDPVGGTALDVQHVEEGALASKPEAGCTKLGYVFDGWDFDFAVAITSDTTIVAKWKVDPAMKDFVFTSDGESCTITGVSDQTNTSYVVPDYVTAIEQGAFAGCNRMERLTVPFVGGAQIPENLNAPHATEKSLFGYIFGTSPYEGSVEAVQKLSASDRNPTTFYLPSSLTSVSVRSAQIVEYSFHGCKSIREVLLGEQVRHIGSSAFAESGLLEIVIPDTVSTLSGNAFDGCYELTRAKIGEGITELRSATFRGCIALKEVTLPSTLTKIGALAFYACKELEIIRIPSAVTLIEHEAFSYCSSLVEFVFEDPNGWKLEGGVELDAEIISDPVSAALVVYKQSFFRFEKQK